MLQNRFYLGQTSYKASKRAKAMDEMLPGEHPALISEALYDQCQEARRERRRGKDTGSKRRRKIYPLASILVCPDCGSRWRAWTLRGARRYRNPAKEMGHQCPQSIKSTSAATLEKQAEAVLLEMLHLPDDWRDRILQAMHEPAPDAKHTQEQRTVLEGQINRAKYLFLHGDLEEKEYAQTRAELQQELDRLPVHQEVQIETFERAAKLLADIRTLWKRATAEEHEQWYKAVFHRVYVDEGQIKAIEPTKVLWALLATVFHDTLDGDDGCRHPARILLLIPPYYRSAHATFTPVFQRIVEPVPAKWPFTQSRQINPFNT
jgi:hypothetical protein